MTEKAETQPLSRCFVVGGTPTGSWFFTLGTHRAWDASGGLVLPMLLRSTALANGNQGNFGQLVSKRVEGEGSMKIERSALHWSKGTRMFVNVRILFAFVIINLLNEFNFACGYVEA